MAEYRPPALPDALIEAMAAAIVEFFSGADLALHEHRCAARAAAAALLDGCKVRQEWRQVRPNGGTSTWFQGALRPGPPGWGAERRLVITTPAEPVEETREDGTQP